MEKLILSVISLIMFLISIAMGLLLRRLNELDSSFIMNCQYARDVKIDLSRDIDNLTKYINDNKNAMLDYFNLEVERSPIRFKKKGK